MKPTVVIIGAGSVEFTRELLGDILSFPELGSVRVVLHDIDAERLRDGRGDRAGHRARGGRRARDRRHRDRRRALDGADYVINVIQVGGHARGDGARLRDPGAIRAAPDHRRHHRRRRNLPRAADLSGAAGIARDMAEVCPDAWLLNYTNPMAMNVTYLHAVGARR